MNDVNLDSPGARFRLADGTHKLDFVSGIGVYGFGHSDRDLRLTP